MGQVPAGAPAAPKPATWLTPSVLHRSAVRASYLGAVSSNEQKHGFATQWGRGSARCQNTSYRKLQESSVGEHLRWHAPAAQPRPPSRRGTSSTQQENGLTWDLGRQKTYQAQAPRFAARSVLEERRASQPDTSERDAARFRRWSEVNAAKQVAEKARRATEAQLLQAWPHGLPATERRKAAAAGLQVIGLGAGEAWSYHELQHRALKSSMKM
ncbi:hypothetical protein QBZ16_003859 [Prototheca wickerhamii]|uniref:Uncharacterized protein n=1 Tax=Prototheca wickerhamii TaxID=3111 RepID=A0AAD9IGI6_PROWI|nr:hypothetical protein QBZ16_003859 [Prototheca wickerhamii]